MSRHYHIDTKGVRSEIYYGYVNNNNHTRFMKGNASNTYEYYNEAQHSMILHQVCLLRQSYKLNTLRQRQNGPRLQCLERSNYPYGFKDRIYDVFINYINHQDESPFSRTFDERCDSNSNVYVQPVRIWFYWYSADQSFGDWWYQKLNINEIPPARDHKSPSWRLLKRHDKL